MMVLFWHPAFGRLGGQTAQPAAVNTPPLAVTVAVAERLSAAVSVARRLAVDVTA